MENLRTGLDREGMTEQKRQALLDKAFSALPDFGGAPHASGRHAVGRRTADARHRLRYDARAENHLARRADRRTDAAHGVADPHIIEVLRKEGVAILLVEQNVPLTLEVSQRVYIMEKGICATTAPPPRSTCTI